MRRYACLLVCAAFWCGIAGALEVDEPELRSTGQDSVQFESYTGPYAVIETAAAITNIGTELGAVVARDVTAPVTVRPEGKYTLIHAVGPAEDALLDADILVLNGNAGVDHIRNLRRIIAGYLRAAYGYSPEDADTVATFVTVYNAVYRGNLPYFEGKYKPLVTGYLDGEKVGLSRSWEDWAGNTQIVIPLSDLAAVAEGVPGASAVDTTAISDPQVVDALRQEEDRGVAVRENLTEIKEREARSATEQAQEAQRTATQERAAAAAAETPEARAAALENAAAAAQVAVEQQQIADRKQTEVRTERQEIAKDKQAILAQPPVETNLVTGLFGANDRTGLYTLVTLDAFTGKIMRASPVTQIRGKSVFTVRGVDVTRADGTTASFDELYLAICGVNDGHSAVRLCLIDTERLELQKQSAEVLAESSDLLLIGEAFIVIVQDEAGSHVAAYDKDLTLLARSSVNVKPTTPVTVTAQGLLVTEQDGRPRLLDPATLGLIW